MTAQSTSRRRRAPVALLAAAGLLITACGAAGSPETPTSRPTSVSSSPGTPSVSPTATPTSPCSQAARLATWPLSRLAAQVLVAPVYLDDLGAATSQVRAGVGGLILFGSAVPPDLAGQLQRLDAGAPGGVAPIVMSDEEGGAVQRLRALVGAVPSARQMAATMSPAEIEQLAVTVGRRMRAAGVTMDLAPVLDLDDGPGPDAQHPDGTRSFGTDPVRTSADALAFARGLRAAGVIPVVKHFPGLGGATGNTDDALAATVPWATLRGSGLLPFRDAVRAGIPAVMVANASVPGLTARPASISPTVVTTVLRGELGFRGLIVTDSVSAKALVDAGYDVPAAAVAALAAGADLVLYGTPSTTSSATRLELLEATVQAITSAVGSSRLSRSRLLAAAANVLTTKGVDLCR